MPLILLVPQRTQLNLDLTDQATVLSVAFSVTNYRYSNMLGVTANRADDVVLGEAWFSEALPVITINDASVSLVSIYPVEYMPVTLSGAGDYSLALDVLAEMPNARLSAAGDYSLALDVLSEVPNATLGPAGDYSLALDVRAAAPNATLANILSGATYASDRDTVDPYLANVTLLMSCDGANGSGLLTDLISHPLSTNGNVQLSTAQAKFGTASLLFDGTGDYFTSANSSDWAFGTGDLTIECWIYPTAYAAQPCVIDTRSSAAGAGLCLVINSSGYPALVGWNSWFLTGAVKVTLNTWQHLAIVRIKGVFVLYLNGSGIGTATAAAALTDNSLTIGAPIAMRDAGTSYKFSGYMDAIRITKGVGRYLEHFTPPAVMYPVPAVVVNTVYASVSDPLYASAVLVLDMESYTGVNSTLIQDAKSHAITVGGNPTLSTIKAKFGATSLALNGSTDYLNVAALTELASYAGDVTIECFFNLSALPAGDVYNTSMYLIGGGTLNSNAGIDLALGATTIWFNQADYGTRTLSGSWSPAINTWYHLAVIRSGNTWTMYLNGTSIATATSATAFSSAISTVAIGRCEPAGGEASGYFNGYIDQLRVLKAARYTSAFIVPNTRYVQTDPYASKVQLHLTMEGDQGGTVFWDATGKAVTKSGTITTDQGIFKVGTSSAKFVSGSYMTVADNAAMELAANDMTLEMWVQSTSTNAYVTLMERTSASSFSSGAWSLMYNVGAANGRLVLYVADYSTGAALITASSGNVADGQWHHVAWTRKGSTHTLWLDGVSVGTGTWAGTVANLTTGYNIGYSQNFAGRQFAGYIDDLRYTVGVARYYTAFTPAQSDPYWNNVSVLLPLNSDTVDVKGHTTTTSGSVTAGSSTQSRVYPYSTYINSGLVLLPADASMEPAGNDFTYEFWYYTASSARQWVFAAATDFWTALDYNGTSMGMWASSNGTSWNLMNSDAGGNGLGTITMTLNKWHHIAFVRLGNVWTSYIDGVLNKSVTVAGSVIDKSTQQKRIGNHANNAYPVNAYMNDFRFTKGVARYLTNFTPTDAPVPRA